MGLSKRTTLGQEGTSDALGWVAVLGTFTSWFAWIGIVKGMAVMLPTLQEQFDSQTWLVGWMVSSFDGCIDLAGPLASPLKRRVGVRTVVLVSGVLVGASLMVVSLVSSLAVMTLVLALVAAPAVGVCNIVTRELIGQCYSETHTRAFGIGASGGSLAFVVVAPLMQILLDAYGWRGATMLLGTLLLHLVICGALFRTNPKVGKLNDDYKLVPGDTSTAETSQKRQPIFATMKDLFKIDLFTSLKYWLVVFVTVCTTVTTVAWVVYFAPNANQSKGFSLADTAAFITVFGVGKIVGNFVTGIVDRCKAVGPNVWMGLTVFGSSACYLADPILVSYWSIMVYVFIYGCCHSFVYTFLDVIAKESVGLERLGSALGWIGLKAGLVRALFLFFPGLIYDTFGSYTLAFILLAAINALALVGLLALAWLQRRK